MTSRRSSKAGDAAAPVEFPLAAELRLSGARRQPRVPAAAGEAHRRLTASTRGQWYFLRVLWTEDGLSQRELSARVGMMEPTTVIALRSMEKSGLIRRVRSADDRRKVLVWLTPKAKRLRDELLGVARHHRRSRGGHRAARSRAVPAHRCADDRESRSDRALVRERGQARHRLAKPARPKRDASPGRCAATKSADA